MEYQWPWNLMEAINTHVAENEQMRDFGPISKETAPDDLEGSLYYLLFVVVPAREREMLLEHYREYRTLESVAKDYGVTRERVRQMINKSVNRLVGFRRYLRYGVRGVNRMDSEKACKKAVQREMESFIREYNLPPKPSIDSSKLLEAARINATPLEDLDLSVRSYNCLKRRGLKTAGDVVRMKHDEFLMIRNLGKKSAVEVAQKLISIGCEADHLMPY